MKVAPIPFDPEEPQPLVRDLAPPAPYPAHCLGPLAPAVRAVQGMTQAPLAIAAQSALAAASLAVQAHADVETLGGTAPLSLYLLTIARSGERKSSCDKPLVAPVRLVEREGMQAWEMARDAAERDAELWKAKRAEAKNRVTKTKGPDRAAARAAFDDLGPEPALPPTPERIVTEPTIEGLERLYAEGQPSLALLSDEGGRFLGGHAMNSDNRQKTLAALNALWGGEPIRRTRAGDGSKVMHGRRLAFHLMAQPEVTDAFLADALAGGIGFLPRCLMCHPPSTIGTRFHAAERRDPAALDAFGARIEVLLRRPPAMGLLPGELEPRTLRLTPDARAVLIDYADAIEAEQAAGGDLAHVTGHASKSAEQAARLAGVLTVFGDPDAVEVGGEAMRQGIALAQFYLGEAVRLTDAAVVSPETARAEALRRWLAGTWPERARAQGRNPGTVLPADVAQYGPNALRETKAAKAALGVLAGAGWVSELTKGTVVDGRPRALAYALAPALWESRA